VTLIYVVGVLGIMIPLRLFMHTRRADANPQFITRLFGALTSIHMFLCLSFLLYSLIELSKAEDTCWKPFTWLYLNYYLLILIVIGPAMTLGVILIVVVVCMPCILHMLIKSCKDERERTRMGEMVVDGLARRSFNPRQFKAQTECVICMEPFEGDC
jgi:hypothetical protein